MRITMKGGVWKNSEDEVLKAAVMKYGLQNWSRVASLLVRKSAKQCKARWYEWLDPSVKKTEWSREEEEKLLHLAKTFPTQWRTIAPLVGRTAHQCMEHYERLLDQAQGKDPAVDDPNDPRKLRPGEIDPQPETKPSKADAVDMADDEREMLSEARARLANTRGKKAKRKAREKQLEQARRMASLQKRRELKAAGIAVGRHKGRKGEMDYGTEVPFEKQPPAGFHSVGADETPESNLTRANINLQEIEGVRRDQQERRLRQEDARKLKRLMDTDLPKAMALVDSLNDDVSTFRKRTKLNLPVPQLSEDELDQIVRLGYQTAELAGASASSGTSSLVGDYSVAPTIAADMMTPRTDVNPLMLEAQNALARQMATNPLEGGENPELHDVPLSQGAKLTGATPYKSTPAGKPTPALSSTGGQTPNPLRSSVSRGTTPLRDGLSLNLAESDAMSQDSFATRESRDKDALLSLYAKSSLQQLPTPINEIEVSLPGARPPPPEAKEEAAEDQEDVMKREQEAALRELQKETKVIQQGHPRPFFVELGKFPSTFLDGPDGLADAEDALHSEMYALLCQDAVKYPVSKGVRPPKNVPPREDFDLELLAEADANLEVEAAALREANGDVEDDRLEELWTSCASAFAYSAHAKRHVLSESLSTNDECDSLARRFDDVKEHLKRDAVRANKMEKRIGVLTAGYKSRAKGLLRSIDDSWAELKNAETEAATFRQLQAQERAAVDSRKHEAHALLEAEKKRNEALQSRFLELTRQKGQAIEALATVA